MKYIKTYENFNYQPTNEGWLWGEGNIWSKIGNWVRNWKDQQISEGANLFNEWAKENPEKIKELEEKIQPELDKLSYEEKKELSSKIESFKGETPPTEVISESFINEDIFNFTDPNFHYDEKKHPILSRVKKIFHKVCKWLGWTVTIGPTISAIVAGISDWLFGSGIYNWLLSKLPDNPTELGFTLVGIFIAAFGHQILGMILRSMGGEDLAKGGGSLSGWSGGPNF